MSSFRIGGLASGMDISQMVTDLMKAQRMRVDQVKQNKQVAEWQREYYREINNSLRALRDNTFNMKLQGTFLSRKASSGNEAVVKVSASGIATEGIYQINVSQLAEGAHLTSQGLSPLVDSGGNTLTIRQQLGISGAQPADLSFTLNDKTININIDTDNIENLAAKINEQKAGVQASYDRTLNRLFLMTTSTGAEARINLDDLSSDPAVTSNSEELFVTLGWAVNTEPASDIRFTELRGKNARFTLNGTVLEQSVNRFTIAGVTYELTGNSPDALTNTSISVFKDTDAVFNSIKVFIELHNSTIDKVNTKLKEERFKDYPPLTDKQRESLSEDQQKKWEEKARSGLLKGDPLLASIVDKMRLSMSSVVSGANSKFDTLADIGIKTGADYTERGKLYIDEGKLKEAINSNLSEVIELFTKSSQNNQEKGIAVRLYDDLVNGLKSLFDKAGTASSFSAVDNSFMGKKIKGLDNEIIKWEDRLKQIEDRYWKQFTAMEKALDKMNQQSVWLAQQFAK